MYKCPKCKSENVEIMNGMIVKCNECDYKTEIITMGIWHGDKLVRTVYGAKISSAKIVSSAKINNKD